MTCASCGRANRDDSRFCVGCGTALAVRCPACGREGEPDARFCGGCGAALTSSPVPTAAAPAARAPLPATPGNDAAVARKIVTIVFADLVGSTALHERLDAESARRLMDRYYRALHARRRRARRHGREAARRRRDGGVRGAARRRGRRASARCARRSACRRRSATLVDAHGGACRRRPVSASPSTPARWS